MKKGFLCLAFALLSLFSFSQTVHKGSLISVHSATPTLKEGVTMEDFVKFNKTTVIPAYEKAFPGLKMYLTKRLRGQDSSSMGFILMFDSEAVRDKYFNNDGTATELGKAAGAKLSSLGKEYDKYIVRSNTADIYTDWLIE
ncbi:hypothetical protein HRG84_05245 [Flavisolibacter sp. BT320]|nr:hypothetical protein [Flavisolibacter longurius]